MRRFAALALLAATLAAGDAPVITWGAWQRLEPGGKPLDISYYNLLPGVKEGVELWFGASMGRIEAVIGLPGPDLAGLQRTVPRFDAAIIQGYDADLLGRATPIISRTQAARLPDGRMVVTAGIGPEYGAGGKLTELWPAIFVSPDGSAGTWKHLGPPAGEPVEALKTARGGKQAFRFEGGSLIVRADGTLALYCGWNPGQPGGAKIALLTAPAPEGPWTFQKDKGRIADLAAKLPGGWLFPAVYDLGPHGLLLAGGEKWPPTRIDAAISRDGGASFTMLKQPILTPEQVLPGSTSIKAVRLLYRPQSNDVLAVANPHQKGGQLMYPLYWCVGTLPPPPKR
jgi:hypothetical protein